MDESRQGHSRQGKPALSQGRAWICAMFIIVLVLANRSAALAQQVLDNPSHIATRQELDVVAAVLTQEKVWNRGDLEAYVTGYKNSPDTLYIGKQISRGFAQILADYRRNNPTPDSMGTLAFTDLEVHPLSETLAVCVGKYQLVRPKKLGGASDGFFSLVLEKTALGWKIVLDHTT